MSLSKSPDHRTWKVVLLLTFLAVVLVNYLPFIFLEWENRFEDDPDTLVDATGEAFAIWGIIFLGMIAFSLFQFKESRHSPALRQAYVFLFVAGLASIAFVPVSFTNIQLLTAINLLWHLVALIAANRALRAHRAQGAIRTGWIYAAPSIYLGWVSAATVIAMALGLQELGVSLPTETGTALAAILLLVLSGIGIWLTLKDDGVYGLTVAWALAAIGVEQAGYPMVRYTAWGGAILVALLALSRLVRSETIFFYGSARNDR
ncbi:hypothetical protein [Lewinella sp. W8]|uniref:hypothetical protein n=1 Tax=Lewinella sp. W8 TaxID=2528208 RepID=UPI00106725BB|nr:hypothetical protein [Lewinella sp. W8]MTB49414.1 hypothetical protein [Lewinella sp. W8]